MKVGRWLGIGWLIVIVVLLTVPLTVPLFRFFTVFALDTSIRTEFGRLGSISERWLASKDQRVRLAGAALRANVYRPEKPSAEANSGLLAYLKDHPDDPLATAVLLRNAFGTYAEQTERKMVPEGQPFFNSLIETARRMQKRYPDNWFWRFRLVAMLREQRKFAEAHDAFVQRPFPNSFNSFVREEQNLTLEAADQDWIGQSHLSKPYFEELMASRGCEPGRRFLEEVISISDPGDEVRAAAISLAGAMAADSQVRVEVDTGRDLLGSALWEGIEFERQKFDVEVYQGLATGYFKAQNQKAYENVLRALEARLRPKIGDRQFQRAIKAARLNYQWSEPWPEERTQLCGLGALLIQIGLAMAVLGTILSRVPNLWPRMLGWGWILIPACFLIGLWATKNLLGFSEYGIDIYPSAYGEENLDARLPSSSVVCLVVPLVFLYQKRKPPALWFAVLGFIAAAAIAAEVWWGTPMLAELEASLTLGLLGYFALFDRKQGAQPVVIAVATFALGVFIHGYQGWSYIVLLLAFAGVWQLTTNKVAARNWSLAIGLVSAIVGLFVAAKGDDEMKAWNEEQKMIVAQMRAGN
ncbi:MAG: hypothetical protein JST35_01180 [Armatimonadetes bacterium]|nr:hypothetical protein [Armatimonadota bacterium]